GPVAHENGITGLPYTTRFFFTVSKYPGRRDRADPTSGALDGRCRLAIVDGNGSVSFDNLSTARRLDPFEGITGQALISLTLEDESPHVGISGLALLVHDHLGSRSHLVPGPGYGGVIPLE